MEPLVFAQTIVSRVTTWMRSSIVIAKRVCIVAGVSYKSPQRQGAKQFMLQLVFTLPRSQI